MSICRAVQRPHRCPELAELTLSPARALGFSERTASTRAGRAPGSTSNDGFRLTHTPEAKASDDFVRPTTAVKLAEATGDTGCSRREPALDRNTPFNMSLDCNIAAVW